MCLQADGQGFYPAKVVLVNSSDIRVFELEVTCTPSTTQAEILFSSPAMQSVVQEIPIVSIQCWQLFILSEYVTYCLLLIYHHDILTLLYKNRSCRNGKVKL